MGLYWVQLFQSIIKLALIAGESHDLQGLLAIFPELTIVPIFTEWTQSDPTWLFLWWENLSKIRVTAKLCGHVAVQLKAELHIAQTSATQRFGDDV